MEERVRGYQRKLAPQPRRAMKAALIGLAAGRGDIKALEGECAGLYRLRVSAHRVIFRYADDGSIRCFFAEHRSIVYEVLAATLQQWLPRKD